ncbi:MAG: hypothetical protein BM558_10415 [Roseobacter sp. MedPE-SW]|nr:MAG: hypothetical protein BM558_10415 [Roseobacter sp. MedPE-SW]
MTLTGWIILGAFAALIVAVVVHDTSKPRRHRPLAKRQPGQRATKHPKKPELGLEAVDRELVEKVQKENKRLQELNQWGSRD